MKNERKTFAEERKMTARQIKRWKRYQKYQQKRAEERKKQRNEQLLRQREQTRSSNSSRLSKSPPRHMEHQPQIIHIHVSIFFAVLSLFNAISFQVYNLNYDEKIKFLFITATIWYAIYATTCNGTYANAHANAIRALTSILSSDASNAP